MLVACITEVIVSVWSLVTLTENLTLFRLSFALMVEAAGAPDALVYICISYYTASLLRRQ
jgi:hypothetical protein